VPLPVDAGGTLTRKPGRSPGLTCSKTPNGAINRRPRRGRALLKARELRPPHPTTGAPRKPTIFRATRAVFCLVEGFRAEAMAAIGPRWSAADQSASNRIEAMVRVGRLVHLRQRTWGVRSTQCFYHRDNGAAAAQLPPALITSRPANRRAAVPASGGSAARRAAAPELAGRGRSNGAQAATPGCLVRLRLLAAAVLGEALDPARRTGDDLLVAQAAKALTRSPLHLPRRSAIWRVPTSTAACSRAPCSRRGRQRPGALQTGAHPCFHPRMRRVASEQIPGQCGPDPAVDR